MRVLLSAIMPLAALLKGGDAIKAAALPAVSAVADTLPGFNATSWFGLYAASGTPQPVADKRVSFVQATLEKPGIAAKPHRWRCAIAGLLSVHDRRALQMQRHRGGLRHKGQLGMPVT